MTSRHSLKRRLTASVAAIFIVSWLVSAGVASLAARVVLQQEMDRFLAGVLLVAEAIGRSFLEGELAMLSSQFDQNMVPLDASRSPGEGTAVDPVVVRLELNPLTSPLGPPSLNVWVGGLHILVGDGTPAFSHYTQVTPEQPMTQLVDGQKWRVLYRRDPQHAIGYAVGMAERQARLDGTQLLVRMVAPLMIVIPLTVLALYYGIARGLQPLRRLARALETRRRQGALDTLPRAGVPEELQPVVEALNHLLERLDATLDNEKRFTANAAHELQTLLAAISTEVQLCQRLLREGQGREMMERINARVQRCTHTVRQLLVLARLDPQECLPRQPVALAALCQEAISELGHLASARRLDLVFAVADDSRVDADREALLILLRNLVQNAFRYTPQGGRVRIASTAEGLVMENDSGPIDAPERLTERFYRASPHADGAAEPGSGLGLSIVRRICELHGFGLSLRYDAATARFVVALSFRGTIPDRGLQTDFSLRA
jgi:signal transduction histidine kinase